MYTFVSHVRLTQTASLSTAQGALFRMSTLDYAATTSCNIDFASQLVHLHNPTKPHQNLEPHPLAPSNN
jgi:hypothetical protein